MPNSSAFNTEVSKRSVSAAPCKAALSWSTACGPPWMSLGPAKVFRAHVHVRIRAILPSPC
jgi:hypothetical protein